MPALCEYTAYIVNTQYIIRAVLLSIDKALRLRAKQEAKPVEHTDLDALIGSWQEDEAFDRAIADFEKAFI